jgi:2-dehydro-3-deoxygluconokinase
MGHEDARAILGEDSDQKALEKAASLGPQTIVLKRAENGACLWHEGNCLQVPPFPVEKVIDPVGAGDGFDAGFLSGWLRGLALEECLRLGARIGAAAVSVLGDYQGYPTLEELS